MAKKTLKKAKAKTRVPIGLTPVKTESKNKAVDPDNSRSDSGRFVKGQSGNPDGKPVGTKSERVKQWEEFGKAIIEGNLPWMMGHLEELQANNPDRAFDRLMDLMEYFKPKLSRQELKAPPGSEVTYTLKFK